MLKNKIEADYSILEDDEQPGFRARRSTIDHLFCITQLIENEVFVDEEEHLLFKWIYEKKATVLLGHSYGKN